MINKSLSDFTLKTYLFIYILMYDVDIIFAVCSVSRPDNLYKPEDLNSFTSSGDVLLDVCTADNPVQLMLDRSVKKVRVCLTFSHIYGSN